MTPEAMATLHAQAMEHTRPWSAAEFRDLMASKLVFSKTTQNSFALGRVVADEAELLTIAVAPIHRRKGVGRTTLINFETEAKHRGASRAFLDVSANNFGAIQLYRSSGWQEIGRRKGYYASGEGRIDAILMEKQL